MKNILKNLIVSVIRFEAKLVLRKYKPKIVAVTGSVGKTSTKDAIVAVLSVTHDVRGNEKSFNNEIGIPLTILNLKNAWWNIFSWLVNFVKGFWLYLLPHKYPEWLVLEIGADKPGDIKWATDFVTPDVVVVTRVGDVPVHVEAFESVEEVWKEKAHLPAALKQSGILILNYDDQKVMRMAEKAPRNSKVITFGFGEGATLLASNYNIHYEKKGESMVPDGISFKVDYNGMVMPVRAHGIFGRQNVYIILAALAVGVSQGVNFVSMIEAIASYKRPLGRFKPISGVNGSTIFDDTYNSSPTAAHVALETLADMNVEGRKIAVLGDMRELGKYSEDEHRKVGALARGTCDVLVTVGPLAIGIAEGAIEAGMNKDVVYKFKEAVAAGDFLQKFVRAGDLVLVKGSQGIRMERTVEKILAEPKRAGELLVRQDAEWRRR